jgi:hypothetical protein
MLKMHRKPLLIVALLLCIAGASSAAYCYLFVTSNTKHVDMQYKVDLSTSVTDSSITLNAAVTNNGILARAGITVDFYYSLGGGPWTYFATQLTDAAGLAQATYTATTNGGYDFEAIITVP